MIQVHNLEKSFNGRAVVRGLSFSAPDGAITGLLGANGAGKSTTLRMICGVLRPDAGSVAVDGETASRQQRIGALLDHHGIYARLTVRENLEYFGRLRGIPAAALAERVAEVIAMLGLERMADRRTAGFSRGEHMKTALARALLHAPRNVLLDEPANGLDVAAVRALREVLRRLRDAGACVIFSSHVLDEMRALCDNVVIIDRGRIAADGSPVALCAQTGASSLEDAFIQLTCQREESVC